MHEKHLRRYEFSSDERFVVLTTASEGLYRHSFYANFYVYDFDSGNDARPITDFSKGKQRLARLSLPETKWPSFATTTSSFPTWPQGQKDQVTNDGATNTIINGATD